MSKSTKQPPAEPAPGGDPREKGLKSVVAVGGSAGALDAFQRLLASLPADTNMAFVMILHLSPDHQSALAEILGRSTQLPVRSIENGLALQPNHVYVAPPRYNVLFANGHFALAPRGSTRGGQHPVDHFMRSLAEGLGARAIGVVLSGTGDDGSLGISDIKAGGGITFAQDESAQHAMMPSNAVASGTVDFVLSPEAIAEEIGRIAAHPFTDTRRPPPRTADSDADLDPEHDIDLDEASLQQIFDLLRHETGVAFKDYRRNTINRRILRRMALHRMEQISDYVQFASSRPREIEALYHDILINVTTFFRDPEAFETLKRTVFPRLIENKGHDDTLRVWVLGCSNGQEAYSVAMSYVEFNETSRGRPAMQVFATDANAFGIQTARAGIYAKGIEEDVSPERLERFFTEVDGSYRVSKAIREMCIFARHDALSEPPFSRIDLLVCRNVLIYFEPVLQRKLMPTLHYSLNPNGYLWLGGSETVGHFGDLFETIDSRHRIYRRKPGAKRHVELPAAASGRRPEPSVGPLRIANEPDTQRDAERLLLARYSPPAVVVDTNFNVVQFRGDTSPYLTTPQGRASLALDKMLREGLLVGVRGAILRAQRVNGPVREEKLHVMVHGAAREVTIVAIPMHVRDEITGTLIVFEEPGEGTAAQARQALDDTAVNKARKPRLEKPRAEVQRLRQELAATREYLQSVIEQLEASNEELQSANEEAQSSNEELQSVNEELETSKEEIQSTNEELNTVNEELQNSNLELTQSNNDLANLLGSVQIAIVMLDPELRIRLFTPPAGSLMNLLATDIGRPFSDIKPNLDVPDMGRKLRQVLETGEMVELETRDGEGHWYWLQIRPYRGAQNDIRGTIVIVIDIDAIKRSGQRLDESETRFAAIADTSPILIWVHGVTGCEFVNRAYEAFVGVESKALRGTGWTDHIHPDDRPEVLAAYRSAVSSRSGFEFLAPFRRADGEYRWMKSIGSPRELDGEFAGYVGSSVDITDLKEAEEQLRNADRAKDEFLATLGHELRNPLAAISNAAFMLATSDEDSRPLVTEIIERQTRNMIRIVDDLLDVSRITHGKVSLRLDSVDLKRTAKDSIAATAHERQRLRQVVDVSLPEEPVWVLADAARLEQILVNLLGNASKYAPNGGHVGLSVTSERNDEAYSWAMIRVSDDGPGIDPAVLPRVFELFVQGERVNDRARSGVGIGLALARHLVSLHGGTIEARNLPDRGAEFMVRLPMVPRPQADAPRGKDARSPAQPRRVLVVDDNVDAAQSLGRVLELLGHHVRIAGNGREAIEGALEFDPEVILLDIGLPDLDGYTVARKLRENERTRHIALIALTGYGREEDEVRAREAGFDLHLKKPAGPQTLSRAIGETATVRHR